MPLLCLLCGFNPSFAETNEPVHVYMPDGQIKSHLLRVFITRDLTIADKPVLVAVPGKLLPMNAPRWAEKPIPVAKLARFQHWTEKEGGQEIPFTGTLLLFDLRSQPFPFWKASVRVTPIIEWGDPPQTQAAVGESPVYIGNRAGSALWTIVAVGALALLIYKFTGDNTRKKSIKRLLASPDGRLSLSKAQAAAWTLAIGAMVFFFGLLRFETPVIPDTLVGLMGLSLITRALSYRKEKKADTQFEPKWSDLINTGEGRNSNTGEGGNSILAVTKAQMLFWTCLVICLFCFKTVVDGVLWDVPWQLVVLMGMSQASYMVPKFLPREEQQKTQGATGGEN